MRQISITHLSPDRASLNQPGTYLAQSVRTKWLQFHFQTSRQLQAHFIAHLNANGIIIHNSIGAPTFWPENSSTEMFATEF